MASISKRTARSWKVSVEPGELERISALKSSGLASQALQALPQRLDRTFSDQRDAEGLAAHYRSLGIEGVTVRRRSTLAWQVRIRIIGAPSLTETFPNKAMAEQWAREREGEIAKRSFVDYREAERKSLADLLLQYDRDKRGRRPKDDPDRVRLRVIAAQPVAAIRMSLLQPSDLCAYRDWRLKGADGIPRVKGTTMKKELELICRVIGLAMREWNIHLAFNPASAERVARPAPEPGDERDRRLEPVFVPFEALQAKGQGSDAPSKRRVNPDSEFERDPEIDELLSMPQTEHQALLRAAALMDLLQSDCLSARV